MQTGLLTPDNFSSLLRDISQKRRQGVLEIIALDQKTVVSFIQGKVVEANDLDSSGIKETILRLKELNLFPQVNLPSELTGYRDLFVALNAGPGFVDEALFRLVVKHRVLQKLYGLNLVDGAHYSFDMRMVEVDRDFSPSISVGQLLLDLVAIEGDRSRFETLFADRDVVELGDTKDLALSEEDKVLEQVLVGKPMTVEQLQLCSPLSSYHFCNSILSLYDAGVLISQARPARTSTDDLDAMFSTLEDSIDSAFGEAGQAIDHTPVDSSEDAEIEDQDQAGRHKIRDFSASSLNLQLLHDSRVLNWIVVAAFIAAALLPLLLWQRVFAQFA